MGSRFLISPVRRKGGGLSSSGAVDHNQTQNLTVGDVHTQYVFGAGRSGGQTIVAGTAVSDGMTLRMTSFTAGDGSLIIERSPGNRLAKFSGTDPFPLLIGPAVQNAFDIFHGQRDHNNSTTMRISNLSAGSISKSGIVVASDVGAGLIVACSSTFTPVAGFKANSLAIEAEAGLASGIAIFTRGPAPLSLSTNTNLDATDDHEVLSTGEMQHHRVLIVDDLARPTAPGSGLLKLYHRAGALRQLDSSDVEKDLSSTSGRTVEAQGPTIAIPDSSTETLATISGISDLDTLEIALNVRTNVSLVIVHADANTNPQAGLMVYHLEKTATAGQYLFKVRQRSGGAIDLDWRIYSSTS